MRRAQGLILIDSFYLVYPYSPQNWKSIIRHHHSTYALSVFTSFYSDSLLSTRPNGFDPSKYANLPTYRRPPGRWCAPAPDERSMAPIHAASFVGRPDTQLCPPSLFILSANPRFLRLQPIFNHSSFIGVQYLASINSLCNLPFPTIAFGLSTSTQDNQYSTATRFKASTGKSKLRCVLSRYVRFSKISLEHPPAGSLPLNLSPCFSIY